MHDFAIFWEWLAFAVRWVHVITAVAWIGSSFYFIALDLGLRKAPGLPEGAYGEEWQVHGGGFYHVTKFLVAPARMPEHLTWFKWESYSTWLSGAALLAVVYWAGAELYLVDQTKLEMSGTMGVVVSALSLTIGWICYDLLCKSKFGQHANRLMGLLFVLLVLMAWGYQQVFTGRAAYLHLGAFTATIMTANVFFIIMPNQRKVIASLKAGEAPDPALGAEAKQRSTHNNYLTLPVIFLMLSNHYPLAFGTEYSWLIAAFVFLMGVLVRHFFNSMHAGKGEPYWTWGVAGFLFLLCIWLSSVGSPEVEEVDLADAGPVAQRFAAAAGFEDAADTVMGRCSMCHAAEPVWDGIVVPPRGVMLETEEQIARQARAIYINAGRSHAMPPGNITSISPEERGLIVAWYEAGIAD
ncbi:urate hydroxylase PuuD [Rhodovulum sp. DZ06]|uniref:urate hydroxylase PuuD n=1 Tax=Rhodovulum sp. DZ06 TaxID=3425126 RepID=UPI003D32DBB6